MNLQKYPNGTYGCVVHSDITHAEGDFDLVVMSAIEDNGMWRFDVNNRISVLINYNFDTAYAEIMDYTTLTGTEIDAIDKLIAKVVHNASTNKAH